MPDFDIDAALFTPEPTFPEDLVRDARLDRRDRVIGKEVRMTDDGQRWAMLKIDSGGGGRAFWTTLAWYNPHTREWELEA